MVCLSQLPNSFFGEECEQFIQVLQALGIIGGFSITCFFIFKWVYQKWRQKHSYTLFFRRGNHGLSDFTIFQTVIIGTHELDVMVRAEDEVEVGDADLRFVIDTKHLQRPRSDADTNVIKILEAHDLDIHTSRFSWRTGYDQAGGIDITYLPTYKRVSGDFIRIKIKMVATQPWEGYLSFRERRIYTYHPFRVVKG